MGAIYPAALLRLAGDVLVEAHNERQVSDRHCLWKLQLQPKPDSPKM